MQRERRSIFFQQYGELDFLLRINIEDGGSFAAMIKKLHEGVQEGFNLHSFLAKDPVSDLRFSDLRIWTKALDAAASLSGEYLITSRGYVVSTEFAANLGVEILVPEGCHLEMNLDINEILADPCHSFIKLKSKDGRELILRQGEFFLMIEEDSLF